MGKMVVSAAGMAACGIYLGLTLVAFLKFPGDYGPLTNWLSDLGNPNMNPGGAGYYNLGCIFAGIALLAFFIGLGAWNTGERKMKILLAIAQISGVFSALSLLITAAFPLGLYTSIHSIASMLLYISLGFVLTFSATALLKNRSFSSVFCYWGFLTAIVNFTCGAFLTEVYVGEWISLGMFIIYVFMISISSSRPGKVLSEGRWQKEKS